jgi:hypothetical protein
MEFLKKHYEKLILSVVLLGLAAVAAGLPLKVNQEKEKEEARKNDLINPVVKPYPPVDLTTNKVVLDKVKSPIHFDIAGKHNLFNPVTWQQRPDGQLIKVRTGNEIGLGALEVTAINPLQMIVTFDDVLGNTNDYKYQVTVIRETDRTPKQSRALSRGQTSPIMTLKEVKGPPEAPTALVLQMPDRSEVTVSKEQPFSKIIGYSADLRYEPSNWTKKGARKGDPILLGNETYNIVAIEKDTVVFSAKSNQKQTPKKVTSSPK